MSHHYVYELPTSEYPGDHSPSGNDAKYGYYDYTVGGGIIEVDAHEEYDAWSAYLVREYDDE